MQGTSGSVSIGSSTSGTPMRAHKDADGGRQGAPL